ncbi:MAG TPA: PEP/pyruvate-binding domain-containing protein [bacterium]
MNEPNKPIDKLLEALQERDKELNCLYKIEELLNDPTITLDAVFEGVLRAVPLAWQFPEICKAKIIFDGKTWLTPGFRETPWFHNAHIIVQNKVQGTLSVYYTRETPAADDGPFLKQEVRLIHTIADRLGQFIQYQRLRQAIRQWQSAKQDVAASPLGGWRVVLELLNRTDQNLVRRISQKMLIRLCWSGVQDAETLFQQISSDRKLETPGHDSYENTPSEKNDLHDYAKLSAQVFSIAATSMSDDEILSCIQKWIQEDRSSFLVKLLANFSTSLSEIADAVRRFEHIVDEGIELSPYTDKELRVSLIRRFFTEQLDYINIAKNYVEIADFFELLNRITYPQESHGQLGGKSAGLFLASRVLRKEAMRNDLLKNIKTPKTWHITSDAILAFVNHNNLEELVEHKYKDIDEIRREYSQIVQLFKHCDFPPEIAQGLSLALDDFGEHPLIVRSSSLLEDRLGAAFSGKYKSLFLANQGPKQQRLEALMDAVAEVYSSTFGPDPVEYRAERGLLDFPEEMGIMIQEVVGTKIGKYFLPAYAGVAFSNNEFRWSPRIRREDGLVRLVMGLGTRAVDRLSDDYPILMAPGQPGLRVNITTEEVIRYAPNKIDVINLETNCFETIDATRFLKDYGEELPGLHHYVSMHRDHQIQQPTSIHLDCEHCDLIVTFEGLITRTPFVKLMKTILNVLEQTLGTPVDIEFASDGKNFYLLQCRPQSHSNDSVPVAIPRDVPKDRIVFTANRYISNGKVPDITHVVYVDPAKYLEITDLPTLMMVGRAVGRLNAMLPRRQFILMGPGRWGSRGDVKLGVSVTYSEIKNTAALIEIARKRGNYVPDLSFGTHFFQDLVESSIRYLPLYPDDNGVIFNETFFLNSRNILTDLLPEFAEVENTVRVIDVPESTGGQVLRVLMNAGLDEAIGFLATPPPPPAPRSESRGYAVD